MANHALECFRESGRIASHCREWAREQIKPGVTIRAVTEGIEAEIERLGAKPGFPAQSSRNHVAAHYCSSPDDTQEYEEGDVVKVDLGVHVDGYITDTALTVDLSEDGKYKDLVEASRMALEAAIETAGAGVSVNRIGAAIESTITSRGFKPVRNLTGHGVSRWLVHCAPQIPNVADGTPNILRAGQVVAIEPFASTGRGLIKDEGTAEVFMMARRRPPRNTRGMNKDVLEAILAWNGLPIARRYFRKFPEKEVLATLKKLIRAGELHPYPPLVERPNAMVAQTEHCLYIHEDGVEVLTR